MESYPFRWKLEADLLEIRVRFSIFIITGACAGLPALVWSVSDLIHHRKNGHQISVFITLLLLTDFVEIFLSPYILIKQVLDEFFLDKDWTSWVFCTLWQSSRVNGLLLNQLAALEGILSVKYPLNTASVFYSPYFIIFYIFLFLYITIGLMFLFPVYYFYVAVCVLISSVIIWIISCGSADHHSHTSRKPDFHILVIFILTLLVFNLPFIAYNCFRYFTPPLQNLPLWHIPFFLVSMRLISDPLLCVLVCRQNLRIQTSQNPEETSLV